MRQLLNKIRRILAEKRRALPIAAAAFAGLVLSGCTGTPVATGTTADAQAAVIATAAAVTAIGTSGSSLLTKAASAACAGQALANVATDLFTSLGKTSAAATSASVSGQLGTGCTWGSLL